MLDEIIYSKKMTFFMSMQYLFRKEKINNLIIRF